MCQYYNSKIIIRVAASHDTISVLSRTICIWRGKRERAGERIRWKIDLGTWSLKASHRTVGNCLNIHGEEERKVCSHNAVAIVSRFALKLFSRCESVGRVDLHPIGIVYQQARALCCWPACLMSSKFHRKTENLLCICSWHTLSQLCSSGQNDDDNKMKLWERRSFRWRKRERAWERESKK